MRNKIKYYIPFLFIFSLIFVIQINLYSQTTSKIKGKIKRYEYYNTATQKVSGIHERFYINDSTFYETNIYSDSGTIKTVIADTFKVINNSWFYKLGSSYQSFLSIKDFKRKKPTIKKAYNFKGIFYGYGACVSYTPVSSEIKENRIIYKFYVEEGNCKGGIPKGRVYNPTYYFFNREMGFVLIKDRFDEFKMRVVAYF